MTKWSFLTASRNDASLLSTFLDELASVLKQAGRLKDCTLYFVDDFSLDDTQQVLSAWSQNNSDLAISIISLPTNLGNQGAMAHGLKQIETSEGGFILSLDSDGEDDLQKIPELMELAEKNGGKVIFTERGRRQDSLTVRLLYRSYRWFFLKLTGKKIIPNNFMVLPSQYRQAVVTSPFSVVYYALAVLRLGLPYVNVVYDRRKRFGGQSSQNLYNLMSHGLVGLMMFFETVIPKILSYLLLSLVFFIATSGFALFVKYVREASMPGWTAMFLTVNFGFMLFLGGLIVILSAFAIAFKLSHYFLSERDHP